MRCKKHAADLSSGVGVCASCLRDRLVAIMEAQALKQSQLLRKSDAQQQQPPPLSFPRSVSPYISRRATDAGAAAWHIHGNQRSLYSTPQLVPAADEVKNRKGHGGGRFSALFLGLFRSKSDKHDLNSRLDHGVSGESCSASPLWFSNMIPGRRRKQILSLSVDESSIGAQQRACRNRDRGMSPARCSDDDDDEHCHGGSSGYSSESSQGWRQTPRRTPAATRRRGGGQNRNISGLAFCLSPLVRASPNRHWNQKGMPPEAVLPGESRAPAKPHLSAAASFCKNRSRKLADFGRYNSRH
ncbi:uncharacterized protein LOC131021114 [Salvia miltiorrhiza]|uniref:uncharacterized protein LOC131021114 n=1 Tax=Salvia miltiorrhiza TaxID=226208 RepID=UPI0025ABF4FC|nr:uncharacterized protein LOC131021114 [Salvia miltiorrhiza]